MIKQLVEIKIRLDRGNALIYWVRNLFLIVASIKYIFTLGFKESIVVGLLGVLALYFLGWIDLNVLKIYQRENALNFSKYNPFFKKKLK